MRSIEMAAVSDLVEMGFSRRSVEQALASTQGNKEAALGLLLGSTSMLQPEAVNVWSQGKSVGLMHISGTAYINSLLQTYFAIPVLAKAVLGFAAQPDAEPDAARDSANLLFSLQRLFAYLALSERKAIDPSPVLARMRDDAGKQVYIGDESYLGEFHTWFISQLEDGLKSERSYGAGAFLDFTTLHHRESFRSLSESEMITDGLISKLFFGKSVEEVHYVDAQGCEQLLTKENLFAHFLLDSRRKDLLSAWQAAMCVDLQEYPISAHQKATNCTKFTWISTLPKVLFFQINHETQSQSFKFPQILYPDQFLLPNSEIVNKLRQKSTKLHEKISNLSSKLEKMENFKRSRHSISHILRLTDGFLTDQTTNMNYTVLDEEQLQVYTPNCLFAVTEAAKEELKSTGLVLDAMISRVNEVVEMLKTQLKEVKSELELLYSSPELTRNLYRLQAVLTREGGCFSVFVYSPDALQWRKFSDESVSEVTESEVMEGKYASVCGVVYVVQDLAQGWGPCSLENYVGKGLLTGITQENAKLKKEFEERQLGMTYSRIVSLYVDRQKACRLHSEAKQYSDIINFPVYLQTHHEEMLSRWVLLDLCVREVTSLPLSQVSDQALGIKLKNMHVNSKVISLKINATEERKIKEMLRLYEEGYRDALVLEYILKRLNSLDFEGAYPAFSIIFRHSNPGKNLYRSQARDIVDIMAFRLTSEVQISLMRQEIDRGVRLLKLLSALTFQYIDEKLLVYRQIGYQLESVMRNAGKTGGREVEEGVRSVQTQDARFITEFSSTNIHLDALQLELQEFTGYTWSSPQFSTRLSACVTRFQGLYAPWMELWSRLRQTNRLVETKDLQTT